MSTRLSSLLVQASVVSVKQIERALERQVLRGGQLDTNLLEIGVSEAVILSHLAKSRDLEPAARSVWPTPPASILSLLTPDVAQRGGLAPLGKEGGCLYVLTHESFSAATLSEVSSRLGLPVVPVIIPEFRVHEALARYYGLPMPPRSAALAAKNPQPPPTEEAAHNDYPWSSRNQSAWQGISSAAVIAATVPEALGPRDPFAKTLSESTNFPDETAKLLLPPEARVVDDPTPSEQAAPPEVTPQWAGANSVEPSKESAAKPSEESLVGMQFDTPTEGHAPVQAPEPEPQDQPTPVEAQIPEAAQVEAPAAAPAPEPAPPAIEPPVVDVAPVVEAAAPMEDQKTPPEAVAPPEVIAVAEVAPVVEVVPVAVPEATPEPAQTTAPEAAPPAAEPAPIWKLDDIKNALMNAELTRDDIFRYLLVFIGQRSPEAFLFQVQQDTLLSREGFRQGEGLFYLQGPAVPIAQSPLFQGAMTAQTFVLGLLREDFGLVEFFRGLNRPLPTSLFVFPIAVKGRVIAVYVGASSTTFTAQDVAEIPPLNALASTALLALIQRKKKSDQRPKERVKPRHGEPYDSDEMNTIPEMAAVRRPVLAIEAPRHSMHPVDESIDEPQTQPKLQAVTRPELAQGTGSGDNTGNGEQGTGNGADQKPAVRVEEPQALNGAPEVSHDHSTHTGVEAHEEAVVSAPVETPSQSPGEELVEKAPVRMSLAERMEKALAEFAPEAEAFAPEVEGVPTGSAEIPKEAVELLSKTIVDDELDIDPSDLLEETPALPTANVLASKLAGSGMQEAFVSQEHPETPAPRPITVSLPSDLLLQTERLERAHETLDTLAALIQTSKPKKAPDPSIEISKLLEQIDLGTNSDGTPVEHAELSAAMERVFSFGDAALPQIFALFPGRRLPKTPGVLRLEEGNLLRLLLRYGVRAMSGLSRLTVHPQPMTRFYAIWCLASLKSPETLQAMLPGMFDAEPMVRQVALAGAAQFAKLPEFRVVTQTASNALMSQDERHRYFASSLAARFRIVELWPLLAERVEDSSPEVAREALSALMTITYQELGPKKKAWLHWFEKHGEQPREAWLVEALSHKELNFRQGAFQELRALTGNTFDYQPDGDKGERKHAIKQWEAWLHTKAGA